MLPETIHELDTPALLIDLDIMERNLTRMASYAAGHGLRLRPHTKTHKIPALGRRQLDLGAAGLTVAKVGEAEVMLSAAPHDLLVAYPTFGARKLARLVEVARHTRVSMSIDSAFVADEVSAAAARAGVNIGILVESDLGMGRVGVAPAQVAALIRHVSGLPGLEWDGIAFYPGHVKSLDATGEATLAQVAATLDELLSGLAREGFVPRVVSGGSTPTWSRSHKLAGLNEIRPGTYIFNDRNTVLAGACEWEDCAGSILTTVVSTAVPGQMIIDGGSKTFSSDRLAIGSEVSFGRLTEAPSAVFTRMNEEHGYVDLAEAERGFKVGDKARVIPNHICVCMNLHEEVYGVRGDRVETSWKVEGRGKLQ
ncbi:MAG: D-TA family PLP-dependent enzyme [Acidobacteria bacterium]|nr:D-TA family PLP-dependent enzyme [Acidobacteriota bacterium]